MSSKLEYIYKINAPRIEDMLLPGIEEKIFPKNTYGSNTYMNYKVVDILKPEYLNWLGIKWDFALVFYKTGGVGGKLHIDSPSSNSDSTTTIWGINWIYGGYGHIHYWEFSDIDARYDVKDAQGFDVSHFTASKPPSRKYDLKTNTTYLVNGSIPHFPYGFERRFALSIRPFKYDTSWERVVHRFMHVITKD